MATWIYRPSEVEEEIAMRALREQGYTSLASFTRDAVLEKATSSENLPGLVSTLADTKSELTRLSTIIDGVMRKLAEGGCADV